MFSERIDSLFHGESARSRLEIIQWWEARRLRYNVCVGLIGLATWWLVLIAGDAAVRPGVDFEEPIGMLIGPAIYGIMANVCYTFGWITDLVAYRGSARKGLFRAGFIFSLVLTALPGLWAVLAWLITLYTGRKLD